MQSFAVQNSSHFSPFCMPPSFSIILYPNLLGYGADLIQLLWFKKKNRTINVFITTLKNIGSCFFIISLFLPPPLPFSFFLTIYYYFLLSLFSFMVLTLLNISSRIMMKKYLALGGWILVVTQSKELLLKHRNRNVYGGEHGIVINIFLLFSVLLECQRWNCQRITVNSEQDGGIV